MPLHHKRTQASGRRHPLAVLVAALGAVAVIATTALATPADASPPTSHSKPFALFTSERKPNSPGLDQYGAADVATVYDAFHFTCNVDGCVSNGGANPMPTKEQYEATVHAYVAQFHAAPDAPVLLDFEAIILSSLKGQAALNALDLWKQLIRWTHEALPQAPVGVYSWDWLTANLDLTKKLHAPGLLDFFAPDAYIYSNTDLGQWAAKVAKAAANDHSIAPHHPIYSFVSPQSGPPNGPSMTAEQVKQMFSVIKANDNGMIIWEPAPAADASACGWLNVFAVEASADLRQPIQSGPLTATAAAPDGSCAAPVGTTPLTVTVTNTSTTTTQATSLQVVYGLPRGVSGKWSDASVPALAPGESTRTTLQLSIVDGYAVSTAPLHLSTTLGNTTTAMVIG